MKYRYDSEAREEYRNAIDFYGKAAERFFDAVESTIERIRNAPTREFEILEEAARNVEKQLDSNFPVLIFGTVAQTDIAGVLYPAGLPRSWRREALADIVNYKDKINVFAEGWGADFDIATLLEGTKVHVTSVPWIEPPEMQLPATQRVRGDDILSGTRAIYHPVASA